MAHGSKRVARGGGGKADRERYWHEQVAGLAGTGLSVREYCEGRGIAVERFYWWRRELSRRECPGQEGVRRKSVAPVKGTRGTTSLFTEVKLGPVCAGVPCLLEVVAAGRAVRVYPGFDAATFGEVVRTLESLGC